MLSICILRAETTEGFLENSESARKHKMRKAMPTAKVAGMKVRLVICFVADRKLISGRNESSDGDDFGRKLAL